MGDSNNSAANYYQSAVSAGGTITGSIIAGGQSRRNREFAERMANSAHQREVEDLKKAGINPVLTATGGSGAPVPDAYPWQMGDLSDAINTGISSAADSALKRRQAKQLDKQEALLDEEIKTQVTQQDVNSASAGKIIADTAVSVKQLDAMSSLMGLQSSQEKQATAHTAGILLDNVKKKAWADAIENARPLGDAFNVPGALDNARNLGARAADFVESLRKSKVKRQQQKDRKRRAVDAWQQQKDRKRRAVDAWKKSGRR